MTKKERATTLYQIVAENMCPWMLFQENVIGTKGGAEEFRKKFNSCRTRADLENLVNEYI